MISNTVIDMENLARMVNLRFHALTAKGTDNRAKSKRTGRTWGSDE